MAVKQKTDREIRIDLLRENLATLRKLSGWTMEQLGDDIGVAKQTIGNLESKKTEMTFSQWFTLRWVLETEQRRLQAKERQAIAAEQEQLDAEEAQLLAGNGGDLTAAFARLQALRERRRELAQQQETMDQLTGGWRQTASAELNARLERQSAGNKRWKKTEQSCLSDAAWLLLDNPFSASPLSERDYREVQSAYEVRAAAASSINAGTLSKIFSATVGTLLTGAGIGLMTAAGWSLAKNFAPPKPTPPPQELTPEQETEEDAEGQAETE